jgi:hypothetical protein
VHDEINTLSVGYGAWIFTCFVQTPICKAVRPFKLGTAKMIKKISVEQLKMGMYLHDLIAP